MTFQLDTSGVVRVPLPFKVTYTSHTGSPTFSPRTGETRYRTTRHFPTEAEALTFCGGRKSMVKRVTGGAAEAHKPVSWSDLSTFCQDYAAALLKAANAPFRKLAPEAIVRIITDCEAFRAWDVCFSVTGGKSFWGLRQGCAFGDNFPPLLVTLGDDGLIYLREAGQ